MYSSSEKIRFYFFLEFESVRNYHLRVNDWRIFCVKYPAKRDLTSKPLPGRGFGAEDPQGGGGQPSEYWTLVAIKSLSCLSDQIILIKLVQRFPVDHFSRDFLCGDFFPGDLFSGIRKLRSKKKFILSTKMKNSNKLFFFNYYQMTRQVQLLYCKLE